LQSFVPTRRDEVGSSVCHDRGCGILVVNRLRSFECLIPHALLTHECQKAICDGSVRRGILPLELVSKERTQERMEGQVLSSVLCKQAVSPQVVDQVRGISDS
jgi:hypothetical protein